MANKYTAEQLKEMIIEYNVLKWNDGFFVPDAAMANLERMCVFDPALLEDHEMGIPYTGPSLVAAITHVHFDATRQEFLRNEVEPILKAQGSPIHDINKLLDLELKDLGFQPTTNNLMYKVNILVQYRLRSNIYQNRPPEMPVAGMSPDFRVYLKTLEGGRWDRIKTIRLFFNYRTTFVHFLASLHDETKQCIIPPLKPIDPDQPDPHRRASVISLSRSESPERNLASQSTTSTIRNARRDPQTSLEPIFRARSEIDRGYTLDDGPWICCLTSGGEVENIRVPIVDEVSYNAIVSQVKRLNSVNAKSKGLKDVSILVMHSMDYQVEQQARVINRREQSYMETKEEEFQEACRRGEIAGVNPDDEDDFGEPYVEWLMKDLRGKKKLAAEAAKSRSSSGRPSSGIGSVSFPVSTPPAATGTPPGSGPSTRGGTPVTGYLQGQPPSAGRVSPILQSYDSPTPANGASRPLPPHLARAASSHGRRLSGTLPSSSP